MARFIGPSENEILQARRLQRKGASLRDIHEALGWNCTIWTTQERLKRSGIKIRVGNRRLAHLGESTTTCEDWYDKPKARKTQTP